MKKVFVLLCSVSLLYVACDEAPEDGALTGVYLDKEKKDSAMEARANATRCYAYMMNKDTVTLQLHLAGDTATGELVYDLHEKDRNTGLIKGAMKGDTLWATYTFSAEGSESKRQVVFLKDAGKLKEGYGEQEEQKGEMVFKKGAPLRFGEGVVLEEVDCDGVE